MSCTCHEHEWHRYKRLVKCNRFPATGFVMSSRRTKYNRRRVVQSLFIRENQLIRSCLNLFTYVSQIRTSCSMHDHDGVLEQILFPAFFKQSRRPVPYTRTEKHRLMTMIFWKWRNTGSACREESFFTWHRCAQCSRLIKERRIDDIHSAKDVIFKGVFYYPDVFSSETLWTDMTRLHFSLNQQRKLCRGHMRHW